MEHYNKKHDIKVVRTTNDVNGNPRYLVSWLSLGLDSYEATDLTRRAGLTKYRGKSFGGGFVFQSYNVDNSINFIINTLRGGK